MAIMVKIVDYWPTSPITANIIDLLLYIDIMAITSYWYTGPVYEF